MAKKVLKKVKLVAPGGKATPAPPLGPTLGQAGVNIGEFVTRFNALTKGSIGDIIPVVISVYEDRTFDFIVKKPPASRLILKAVGKEKGSDKAQHKVAKMTKAQVEEVAKEKMEDLNASDLKTAMKIIAGTARSMGVEVAS